MIIFILQSFTKENKPINYLERRHRMITKNVWQRMWRTSLMAVAAIAIFWGIWYLIAGSIPQITVLQIDAGWKLALPFAVSQM
jgi:hypothetical protein